jgi:hypothetical protein
MARGGRGKCTKTRKLPKLEEKPYKSTGRHPKAELIDAKSSYFALLRTRMVNMEYQQARLEVADRGGVGTPGTPPLQLNSGWLLGSGRFD